MISHRLTVYLWEYLLWKCVNNINIRVSWDIKTCCSWVCLTFSVTALLVAQTETLVVLLIDTLVAWDALLESDSCLLLNTFQHPALPQVPRGAEGVCCTSVYQGNTSGPSAHGACTMLAVQHRLKVSKLSATYRSLWCSTYSTAQWRCNNTQSPFIKNLYEYGIRQLIKISCLITDFITMSCPFILCLFKLGNQQPHLIILCIQYLSMARVSHG